MGDTPFKATRGVYTMKTRICSILTAFMFLLGSHRGYLALWKEDRPEPFQIFSLQIASLPEQDQAALDSGITARSETELSSLLEDFLS